MKIFKPCFVLFLLIIFSSTKNISAQSNPEIITYFSIAHPVATFSENDTKFNFDDSYTVGFPIGINFLQSEKIAFSMEFVPTIIATANSSNVNGLLFHPGIIYRNIWGFNFESRLAYNTNGRYGFTALVSKPIIKQENVTYFLAMPVPVRFGNTQPTSVTISFQFGISF